MTNDREDAVGGKDLTGGIILVAYFGKGSSALSRCFGMTPGYVTGDADVRPVNTDMLTVLCGRAVSIHRRHVVSTLANRAYFTQH